MAGRTIDPKGSRITVRIADTDLKALTGEARRRGVTVGAIVRDIIRVSLLPTVTAMPQARMAMKR